MQEIFNVISFEDAIALKLRILFEQFGYDEYKMGKFESYELYQENVNYLRSNSIITFTDSKGRLMALKPDVTMSIVNNIGDDADVYKLYYVENVFRRNIASGEYQELGQIGLEYIGSNDGYSEAEVLMLALRSLQTISDDFILTLSHMGYIQALLELCIRDAGARDRYAPGIVREISRKNRHGIADLCREAGLPDEAADALCRACGLTADFSEALATAGEIAESVYGLSGDDASRREAKNAADEALSELGVMYTVAEDMGLAEHLRVDLSVTNDLDYYNGLLMRGYIAEVPRAILTGGRYDNLMKKCGKDKPAIGFALNMQGLRWAFHVRPEYQTDVLLVYGDAPADRTAAKVCEITAGGRSVRAVSSDDGSIRARETIRL